MSIFKKIWGKKDNIDDLIEDTLMGILERGNFNLSYEISFLDKENRVEIELFGEDEKMLVDRDGQLLNAIQSLIFSVVQNNFSDKKTYVSVDCQGFLQRQDKELIQLADKLKKIVLKKKTPVYFRVLPPKDRRTVYQHLLKDDRVVGESIGEGHFKKIKLVLADKKAAASSENDN